MSKIKGPGGVGAGPKGVAEAPGERPADAADAAYAAEASPTQAASAGVTALFEQVAAQLAEGRFADRGEAVRAAVDRVLDQEMGHLAATTRANLSEQISAALADHPDLAVRLERLLGAAAE